MLRKKVNSRSSKIKQGHIGLLRFFVFPNGYLVARDWQTMKRNHKDVAESQYTMLCGDDPVDPQNYTWIQCDSCKKWRKTTKNYADIRCLNDPWFCKLNPYVDHNNCDA